MATSNPPVVSAESAQYQLWCLIEDDSAPFLVPVHTSTYVAELKKLIYENGKAGILHGTDAKDLTLWKVSTFYTLMSTLT
jgi:hypothetical protein